MTRGFRLLSAFLILAALGACATAPDPASVQAPVPIERFLDPGGQSFSHRLSPDGQRVAWAEPSGDGMTILVRTLADDTLQRHAIDRSAQGLVWAGDGRHLLLRDDEDGDENDRLRVIDTADPAAPVRDLAGAPGVRLVLDRVSLCDRGKILVRSNGRDPRAFDLVSVDIATGAQRMVERNTNRIVWWRTDRCGKPLYRARARVVERWDDEQRRWSAAFGAQGEETFRPTGAATADGPLFAISDRGRDRRALVRVDPRTGEETVLVDDPIADMDSGVVHPDGSRALLASSMPGYPRDVVLDPGLAAALAPLRPGTPHRLSINDITEDGNRLLVTIATERRGAELHLVDLAGGTSRRLTQSRIAQIADRLADSRPISFPTRDGRTLHGYLTTPADAATPLPTVLLVHGGPWARDNWGYDYLVQFLASRGYAVLRINYRGSSGYGRAFRQAAIGEFAAAMHWDLLDGLTFAITTGAVNPARVAIMGASYGGYAALVGMTMTPANFAAGISIVGISDLVRFLETTPPYWANGIQGWYAYVGNPAKPAQRRSMIEKSPITFADRVTSPLLLIHGANDVRVRVEQSERMAEALRALNKPVDLMVFPDEGHGIRKFRNRATLLRTIESFLDTHIGRRPAGPVAALDALRP